ncbi:isocitrate/isopropylmalate family dehydrogenase [Bacteroidia bacterium]|nr:isocitrate/isopropylmalate family dehydrogenase [Bacteroidia bacterium]MDB9883460.1 isocitrate/isopropylmalate family dehydrogenase [Bacteroidia bacterium]
MSNIIISVAKGDGIGPEIMNAVLSIFEAATVPLEYDYVDMGKGVYDKGYSTGMTDGAKASIEATGILFKGPMETPKGGGVKSINVTARKTWNTHSNIRKFQTIKGVDTVFSKAGIPINLTIVRENIEDTYGGIEHYMTKDVAVSRRIISRPGSEQVIRSAFEVALKEGYSTVTCGHKANIMKLTDGMFLDTFYEIAKEYPQLKAEDVIVDALCMKLVYAPQQFECIVLTNLQGDIVSDLCAGLVGGLGFAPSANIGDHIKIFEAVHGTAPDIAGQNKANPTSLLLSGTLMLNNLGLEHYGTAISNALLATIDKGIHTGDFGEDRTNSAGTKEFAEAIIKELDLSKITDSNPEKYHKPSKLGKNKMMVSSDEIIETVGIDLFVESEQQADHIAQIVQSNLDADMELTTITNRGTQVWPEGSVYTDLVDTYVVRIEKNTTNEVKKKRFMEQAIRMYDHLNIGSIEMLITIDGVRKYSLAQGQKVNALS